MEEHSLEDKPQVSWLKSEAWEWTKALLIAFALVAIMRWLLFTPTIVSGPSMEPNFIDGERLIVNKIIYTFRKPERGEVIVFHAPENKDYIKRVIGVPGDRLKIDGDTVYINGESLAEPYIQAEIDQMQAQGLQYNTRSHHLVDGKIEEVTVPEDHVFVLGDNRPNSKDSRWDSVGFIPMDEIVGRADVVFWPLTKFRFIGHPDYK